MATRKPTAALTVAATAEMLQVHPDAVYGWIASGELVAVNVARVAGRRPVWRVPVQAVNDFERRRSNKPVVVSRRKRQTVAVAGGDYF